MAFPASAFVPSKRTTSGTFTSSFRAASTIPSAMMSQRMMPPKMFTKMHFTFASDSRIANAPATFSAVALPPTSRKFAGLPPHAWMMSIVAIARPAPFTMHPMFPSRPM